MMGSSSSNAYNILVNRYAEPSANLPFVLVSLIAISLLFVQSLVVNIANTYTFRILFKVELKESWKAFFKKRLRLESLHPEDTPPQSRSKSTHLIVVPRCER